MRSKELLAKRDADLVAYFNDVCKKNPNYRFDVLLQMVSDKYFLSTARAYNIIKAHSKVTI